MLSVIGTALHAGYGGLVMPINVITVVNTGPGVLAPGQLTIGGIAIVAGLGG